MHGKEYMCKRQKLIKIFFQRHCLQSLIEPCYVEHAPQLVLNIDARSLFVLSQYVSYEMRTLSASLTLKLPV